MTLSPFRRTVVRALVYALGCALGAVLAYWLFVVPERGQRVDASVMIGSRLVKPYVEVAAKQVLDLVSALTIVVATVVIAGIAVTRRRPAVALAAILLVAGANVTTQGIKRLLERPDFGVTGSYGNSFPSGHTTVAASIVAALLVAVGPRARPWVAFLGAAYAIATGESTVFMSWHRPSDVVGALLVVGFWLGLVMAAGSLWRRTRAAAHHSVRPSPAPRVVQMVGGWRPPAGAGMPVDPMGWALDPLDEATTPAAALATVPRHSAHPAPAEAGSRAFAVWTLNVGGLIALVAAAIGVAWLLPRTPATGPITLAEHLSLGVQAVGLGTGFAMVAGTGALVFGLALAILSPRRRRSRPVSAAVRDR